MGTWLVHCLFSVDFGASRH